MRTLKRLWCWLTWHKWKRGTNGWENFGTGIYCSCGTMYNDPYNDPTIWVKGQPNRNKETV